jgi:hypothetical protein
MTKNQDEQERMMGATQDLSRRGFAGLVASGLALAAGRVAGRRPRGAAPVAFREADYYEGARAIGSAPDEN